jgi:hypothetical protein
MPVANDMPLAVIGAREEVPPCCVTVISAHAGCQAAPTAETVSGSCIRTGPDKPTSPTPSMLVVGMMRGSAVLVLKLIPNLFHFEIELGKIQTLFDFAASRVAHGESATGGQSGSATGGRPTCVQIQWAF